MRVGHRARVLGAAAVVAVVVLGVLPAGLPPAVGASTPASAQTRTMGRTPLDDILYWADQRKACGLSRDQLAALMIAPTYPETGASGTQAPSPMTLSRYDTQRNLWAFGDTATPWTKAFWYPGVGMWQFDSAGRWDLTAATAISTWTSAAQAATTMASRWCQSPSRSYVWAPWYGCGGGRCEAIYNQIFNGTSLVGVATDPAVGRDGGMVTRSCAIGGIGTVTCHYVDPARAEGFTGWRVAGWGPTPAPQPFYVVAHNGREYRFWARHDTGYPLTISADKPVRADARSGLNWVAGTSFCDLSARRGDCAGYEPRVAQTPWGPRTAEPFGSLDSVESGWGRLEVRGWAIDPDTSDPIDVHVYVDGVFGGLGRADRSRPDVAAAVPGYGDAHGYRIRVEPVSGGPHTVCAYGINVGPTGSENPLLGCLRITADGNPFGHLDTAVESGPGIRVTGWAIDPDTATSVSVHVYVDGRFAGQGRADRSRPDVAAAFWGRGSARGYDLSVPAAPGTRQVCVYAINVGAYGTTNPLLGCRTVSVRDDVPFGYLDTVTRVSGGVRVTGWAIDPDVVAPIDVHVHLNGAPVLAVRADRNRPDVAAVHPVYGASHGYDAVVVAAAGATVCVYAINTPAGGPNPLLGCRTA